MKAAKAAVGGAALLVLGSALAVGMAAQSSDRLAPGLEVAGVAVGGLTPAEAEQRLQAAAQPPKVTVQAGGRSWTLNAAELGWKANPAAALAKAQQLSNERPLTERLQNLAGQSVERTVEMPAFVDQSAAAAALKRLTAGIGQQPVNGDISFDPELRRYVVKPGAPGKVVDVQAAAAAYAAQPDQTVLKLPLTVTQPQYSTEKLKGYAEQGNAMIRPLKLQLAGSDAATTLSAMQVANLFWATRDGIKLDEDVLPAAFEAAAAAINDPARSARYRWKGDHWAAEEGKSGLELEKAQALETFRTQLVNPEVTAITLPAKPTQPGLSAAELPDPASMELVAVGRSTYYGSSPERRENVAVAARLINGYVVPAGKDFSFLEALGSITPENGFVGGLIISGGRTVDGLGGGVCQVSTTAFRALYTAGLPVVERTQHSYRVKYYEPEVGFEAAVYDPGVDLKMNNDTGAPLMVRVRNEPGESRLTVELWGKKPNREVKVSPAVITSSTPAPAPKWVVNPALAPGTVRQVDWAQGGYNLYITRTIRDAAGTRTERLETQYKPWQAVFETGGS
ncbi:VanW family protein [Deinococcus lacus]|uniref:VanW family protein n=1 Tax=Deinococcus lacus TaxID=392561 RepID=A0ABW1Y9I2_9DEIO